ncbi:MAG: helix-turn-helix domain-containing protein [Clostridia bacterium]|nr:helix-turn-helix domain-containing protein [Clostridia bacterium]
MTNAQILGDKLYRLRKDKGISQEELAYKLNVSRQAISKWERGEALPDTDNLISLAKLYEVSLDELVGNDVESYQPVIAPTASVDVDEDERDCQDDDELPPEETPTGKKGKFIRALYALPYVIVVTVAYILWGCLGNGWGIGWTLYLTVPVYYSIVDCIHHKKVSHFAYPVFCAFVYCFCGVMWKLWHPMWVVFLTIPIFYAIADAIDKR